MSQNRGTDIFLFWHAGQEVQRRRWILIECPQGAPRGRALETRHAHLEPLAARKAVDQRWSSAPRG